MNDTRNSSRTPDGVSLSCPLCGAVASLHPAFPGSTAVCSTCGQMLGRFRDRISQLTGMPREQIRPETTWSELGLDSLDVVELVMHLEEMSGVAFPDEELREVLTLGDLIDLLERLQRETS